MKTASDMEFAANYVKKIADLDQKMLIAEAFVDLFINSNPRFNLMRFLNAADLETLWKTHRVPLRVHPTPIDPSDRTNAFRND